MDGYSGLSVLQGTLSRARYGARVEAKRCFHSGPMLGPDAFTRITVSDVIPIP